MQEICNLFLIIFILRECCLLLFHFFWLKKLIFFFQNLVLHAPQYFSEPHTTEVKCTIKSFRKLTACFSPYYCESVLVRWVCVPARGSDWSFRWVCLVVYKMRFACIVLILRIDNLSDLTKKQRWTVKSLLMKWVFKFMWYIFCIITFDYKIPEKINELGKEES